MSDRAAQYRAEAEKYEEHNQQTREAADKLMDDNCGQNPQLYAAQSQETADHRHATEDRFMAHLEEAKEQLFHRQHRK